MTVRLGTDNVEGILEVGDGGALLEQDASALDQVGMPFGKVGKGAFLDLALVAVGLAQEDARF